MARRRSTVASRGTAPAEPAARPTSTAAASGRSRTTTSTKPAQAVFGGREPSMREIRDRAYYIYLARGGVNGFGRRLQVASCKLKVSGSKFRNLSS